MSKRKTSTQDFLNLLDEDAPIKPQMAMPRSKPAPAPRKLTTKEKILVELIDLAKKKSPKFVSDLITTWIPKEIGKIRRSQRR